VKAGNSVASRAVRHSLQLARLLDDVERHMHDDPEAAADRLEAARAKVKSLTTIAVRGERRRARVLELEAALRDAAAALAGLVGAFDDAAGYSVRIDALGERGEQPGRPPSTGEPPRSLSARERVGWRLVDGGHA
jgi:hypothetical protein